MAVSRCSQPLALAKRIKLFHPSTSRPITPLAPFHTSTSTLRAQPIDDPTSGQPSAPTATSLTTPPSLPPYAGPLHGKPPINTTNTHPLRPQDDITADLLTIARARNIPIPPSLSPETAATITRLPRSLQTLYLNPLRREPTHGIVSANLQLRSYSVRNLELMADFALRAAYYLDLPARGAVPLPRITQRWTVPRSNFIFKKSQENWERVTVRRLVQIQDGHPEVVRRWLGFVRKCCWYGVGMKADVFEYEGLGVAKRMDEVAEKAGSMDDGVRWDLFGTRKGLEGKEDFAKYLDGKGMERLVNAAPPPTPTPRAKAAKSPKAAN